MAADPLGQVERAQDLIARGPILFLCAVLFIAVMVVFGLYVKSVRDREADARRHKQEWDLRQTQWDLAMEKLRREHALEIAGLHKEGREMAVKTEVGMHRMLELLPVIRTLKRAQPRGKTNPNIQLPEPEEDDG